MWVFILVYFFFTYKEANYFERPPRTDHFSFPVMARYGKGWREMAGELIAFANYPGRAASLGPLAGPEKTGGGVMPC